MSDMNQGERTRHQVVGLFLGPLLAIMMLPIAVSIIGVIHNSVDHLDDRGKDHFRYALLLGIVVVPLIALYLGPRFL